MTARIISLCAYRNRLTVDTSLQGLVGLYLPRQGRVHVLDHEQARELADWLRSAVEMRSFRRSRTGLVVASDARRVVLITAETGRVELERPEAAGVALRLARAVSQQEVAAP